MTQTSGAIGQTREVKQRKDTKQQSTLVQRMQRLVPYISSTWLLCILIGAIALGFNLYRLGSPSIWFDEAFSVELARQPLPLIWHIIWGPEPNMELYYLLLHFWLGFTGFLGLHPTEFVVRFPSAICAALSSVMVFLLGRRFLGITAGIVGAGLYWLGVPNAAMWGMLIALLNFVPYFGPFVGISLLAAVGLLTFDTLWQGLLPPAWYLLLHCLESNFITPVLLGRRFTLNPVVIFVSLIFWTWLWGVPGALLSVPILVSIKVVCDHLPAMSPVSELLSR